MDAAALAKDTLLTEPGALDFANIRALTQTDPNLTGQDALIGTICRSQSYINSRPQNDFHFNMNHVSLYDADVQFTDSSDGQSAISEHATSMAGVLLGLDENATHSDIGAFEYRGVCPDASVDAYEFEQFSIQYLLGKKPIEENVLVLSLGIMFEDWWVRGLEQAAAEKGFLVVASVGNGSNAYTPSPLFPAAGSNVLSVGVVDAVTDPDGTISLREFSTPQKAHSSSGPTEDNRCKPDMVAPGTALVPVADNEDGYVLKHNWSSLSAPIVAGTAVLLQQKAMTDEILMKDFDRPGKNLVLKSILMNSAKKLPYWHKGEITVDDDHETPLDYVQGTGLLDAMAAYKQLTTGMGKPGHVKINGWDNRILNGNNLSREYAFEVTEPNQIITATLCWNRAYGSEYPFKHMLEKDTDLRLELWGVDSNNPTEQVLLDYSDSVNDNVEHIYYPCDPAYTTYAIRVKFNDEQSIDPSIKQRFAVSWSTGADRQTGNPWWRDLNGDNTIGDPMDHLIFLLIENETFSSIDASFLKEAFKLPTDRAELLIGGWEIWKPYLSNWNISE